MSLTENPDDLMAIAFAGVISKRKSRRTPYDIPIAGLDRHSMCALMQHYFPSAQEYGCTAPSSASSNADEFQDLVNLLLDHRTFQDDQSSWLAHAVATACMAQDHLWQDMGLPSRDLLSKLLGVYFTSLSQRNTGDMKWKKFFYRQLCERSGLFVCRAPSCDVCSDYNNCFGQETSAVAGRTTHDMAAG